MPNVHRHTYSYMAHPLVHLSPYIYWYSFKARIVLVHRVRMHNKDKKKRRINLEKIKNITRA
jgi:hypothetical protein